VVGRLAQERRCHPSIDRDEEAGRLRQITGRQGEHGAGHVLGKDYALEKRPLRVVLAQLLLFDPVHRRAFGAPTLGEDP
jgi:hypothetical protein